MGVRNRVELSYRPARLHRLAESIPWNRILTLVGSLKVQKYRLCTTGFSTHNSDLLSRWKHVLSHAFNQEKPEMADLISSGHNRRRYAFFQKHALIKKKNFPHIPHSILFYSILWGGVSHIWLCNCSILNFLKYEENWISLFISAGYRAFFKARSIAQMCGK